MAAGFSGDRARVGVAVAFLGHAVIFGTWASRVPAVKHALGLSDAELGLAFFGMAAGTLMGSRMGGALASRVGAWRVVRVGLPVLAAALILAAAAGDQATFTAALVGLGTTAAVVDVAMNSEAVVVERVRGQPLMSGFHGFWSIGLMVGAVAGIGAAALDLRPVVHFALAAAIVAAGSAPFLARLPHRSVPSRTADAAGGWSPKLVVLGLIGFCSFFAEGAAADWSAVYLRDRAGAGAAVAAAAFASFSLAMAVSRLARRSAGGRLRPGKARPCGQHHGGARPRPRPPCPNLRQRACSASPSSELGSHRSCRRSSAPPPGRGSEPRKPSFLGSSLSATWAGSSARL